MIAPMVILICVFKLYPIFQSVIQGFVTAKGEISLDNYRLLFADKTFWN